MSRLILLAIIAVIVWRFLQRWRVSVSRIEPQQPRDDYQQMARCAACGVHLPAAALAADGRCGKCAGRN